MESPACKPAPGPGRLARMWRRLARRAAYRSYAGALEYERRARFANWAPDAPLVAVYQMGKVGSSAVRAALRRALPDRLILHIHRMDPEDLAARHSLYESLFSRLRMVQTDVLDSEYLRARLQTGTIPGRLPVVTLIRDPVARNLSFFFQTLGVSFPDFDLAQKLATCSAEAVARELIPLFWERFNHGRAEHWFDQEPKVALGIDVFAQPFERERGFGLFRGESADLLLLKLERLTESANPAFEALLGLQSLNIRPANEARSRAHGEVYREFKHLIQVPESYLDRFYDAPQVRHFYTEEEVAAFRRRWRPS